MAQGKSENRQSGVDSSATIASAGQYVDCRRAFVRQGQKTLQFAKIFRRKTIIRFDTAKAAVCIAKQPLYRAKPTLLERKTMGYVTY